MNPIMAYVDPGTGATLMQLALAGTVGIAAVLKLKWHSIKAFFKRSAGTSDESKDAQADSEFPRSEVADHEASPIDQD